MIGRKQESTILKSLINNQLNVIVEGAVGVGKTTLIVETLKDLKKKHVRIDGDARFTEDKLVGWFDPSKILKKGYGKDSFIAGPLVECMLEGKILFINELNRLPEGVQNLLLPAIDEGEIQINHIGSIKAKKGFLVIGTQNPSDFVATSDLSEALKDRCEYLRLESLSKAEILEVIKDKVSPLSKETTEFVKNFLDFVSGQKKILNGDSVRIAIALAKVFESLKSSLKGDELKTSVLGVALKNRLLFVQDYSFEQFVADFLKKKA